MHLSAHRLVSLPEGRPVERMPEAARLAVPALVSLQHSALPSLAKLVVPERR